MYGKVNQQNRIAHNNAGKRNPTNHGGRGKLGAHDRMHGDNTKQCQRDRRHNQRRYFKIAEFPYHQHINENERHHESGPHITKCFKGDCPLAGPFNTGNPVICGRPEPECIQFDTIRRRITLRQNILHLKHAVNRRGQIATYIRHHILDGTQVLMVDDALFRHLFKATQFAQRNTASTLGKYWQITQPGYLRSFSQWNLDNNINRLMPSTLFDIAKHHTAERHRQVAIDRIDRDSPSHRFLGVNVESPILIWFAHVVVDIAQALSLCEYSREIVRHLTTNPIVRSVHLRHHRL